MPAKTLSEMRLVVVSHKLCWRAGTDPISYWTDGGFPLQMQAIASLFKETRIIVPCSDTAIGKGLAELECKDTDVVPVSELHGKGWRRKLLILPWLFRNAPTIWREIRRANAVHTPIPGDIGTIGMAFALIQSKPLFVRHCGNWAVQNTFAEKLWRWTMERFAGGRNVMMATGGGDEAPSAKNSNIRWIFSSSRSADQISAEARSLSPEMGPRLITVCRQEPRKGTDIVVEAFPQVLDRFPNATLAVVGDGSMLPGLRERVREMNVGARVRFHGKVSQANVSNLLRESDLFCYPTSASEGFPKVVLEALSVGLPVITTRVSVLPHLLKTNCGVLLDEPSASSLAQAVIDTCCDSNRYTTMSAASLDAARPYTLEAWTASIAQTLNNAWVAGTKHKGVSLQPELPN